MLQFLNIERAFYDGVGEYNIPVIQPVEELPEIDSWIGFNYIKTTKKEPAKTGVHFYITDEQFERVWNFPNRYGRLLSNYGAVISPNFSVYVNFPKAIQVYNRYRRNWIGAYWQEQGLTVIPDVTWGFEDTYDWCFDGLPIGGIVSVSNVGCMADPILRQMFMNGYNEMLTRLQPKQVLLYAHTLDDYKGPVKVIKFELGKQEQGGK